MNKIIKYLIDSDYRWIIDANRGKYNSIPDEEYLRKKYRVVVGKDIDLSNPITYTEKLQWLKLHNRVAEYTNLVDKYEAKRIAGELIGEKYIVPCYGVFASFDEIDFDSLPNQFVIKATHDGGAIVCRDKSKFDIDKAKKQIEKRLGMNYYYQSREWPYLNVKPRILIEKYLEDTVGDALTDYKFFCFDGEPKIMYISKDRGKNPRTDFFDMDFNHLPIRMKDPNAEITPTKPFQFDTMVELAKTLSKNIPHVRVDFYLINNCIYFGEYTFFHNGGFFKINPEEWNVKLGEWIDLSKVSLLKL